MKYMFILLIPLFGACATHAPMSEMVMFTPKKVIGSHIDGKPDSVYTYYSRYSFAFGIEGRGVPLESLERYAEKKFGKQDGTGETYYNSAVSLYLHSIFMFKGIDNFALNISMFPTLGIDFTSRLYNDYYITFAQTVYGGEQVYLQKRLFYSRKSAAAVGIFYERLWQGYNYNYESDCSLCGFGPDKEFSLNVIGIRGFVMDHGDTKNRSFGRLHAKLGYIIDYHGVYGQVGTSFGFF